MKDEGSEDNNLFQIHPNKPTSSEKNDGEDLCKSGLICLRSGKLKEGIQNLKKAMKLGNFDATYKLAIMYEEGINVKEKPQKALQFYKKSLELNYERAKNNYIQLNKKLIEEDDVDAMVDLADFYMNEEKVSKKKQEKAIKLYETASEKGSARAMNGLAQVYEKHWCDYTDDFNEYKKESPIFNKIKALMLYKQASDLGHKEASENLNQLCEELTLNFSQGSKKIFYIANNEKSPRINQDAALLMTYLIQEKDIKNPQFLEFFLNDSHNEDLCPLYVRGWMYENGYGVKQDIMKAFKHYSDIIYYINDNIILSDWSKIVKKAYNTARNANDPKIWWEIANRSLRVLYEPEETRQLFEKIIEEATDDDIKGDALNSLAYMHEKGIGTEKNIETAKKLYKQAFDLGNETGNSNEYF